MCDTNWYSRRQELERLEKSWREFEEFVQWMKQRWSKPQPSSSTAPAADSSGKPQPVGG